MLAPVKISVKTSDYNVELENVPEKTISEVLEASGIFLNQRCGGVGNCGGCAIVLEQGEFVVGDKRHAASAARHRDARACKTRAVGGQCVVRVPSRSLLEVSVSGEVDFELGAFQLDARVRRTAVTLPPASLADHRSDLERLLAELRHRTGLDAVEVPLGMTRSLSRALHSGQRELTVTVVADDDRWRVVALHTGDRGDAAYGLALDVGTTTVAGILVDLSSGKVLQRSTRYNDQLTVADDVASRISAAKTDHDVERLRRLVVHDTVNPIVDSVCRAQGIEPEEICRVAVAGNTVMVHLLLGLHVTSIGRLPFNPLLRQVGALTVGELGIRGNRYAPVTIIPAIAGYVGGDITADIHAADLLSRPDGSLMVDIGTNCEMVLRQGAELVCCAAPAGPAFEGAGLLHGCRASNGAIERITIGPGLQFAIGCIGDRAPTGVCGSAIIDFIAMGYRCGLINRAGRMDVALLMRHQRYARVELAGRTIHACVIVPADADHGQSEILITEADIAEILQAKAAIYAGIKTLLAQRGEALQSIPQLVLAGGFARHIDIENAICIGLLPELPIDRFKVIGNAALAGAYLALVDGRAGGAMRELHTRPHVIELNLVDSFESSFIESLFLPDITASGRAVAPRSMSVDGALSTVTPAKGKAGRRLIKINQPARLD